MCFCTASRLVHSVMHRGLKGWISHIVAKRVQKGPSSSLKAIFTYCLCRKRNGIIAFTSDKDRKHGITAWIPLVVWMDNLSESESWEKRRHPGMGCQATKQNKTYACHTFTIYGSYYENTLNWVILLSLFRYLKIFFNLTWFRDSMLQRQYGIETM